MTTVAAIVPSIPPRRLQLAEALSSIAGQTRQVDEIHVTVDHDGDGPAAARNRSLAAVTAEWVAFLDDDDLWLPDHVAALLEHAEQTGADLVYPWFVVAGGTDPFPQHRGRPFDADRLRAGNFIPVTFLARRQAILDVGGFPLPGSCEQANQEEWALQLRMLDAGCHFEHLDQVTWVWRHWSGNTSGRPWRTQVSA